MNQSTIAKTPTVKESPLSRVGYLDTYRGIACLMVYFYHVAVNIPLIGVSFPGYYGVHLFFVLSGYLMSSKFAPALNEGKSIPDLRKYLTRRFFRIYPPYLICLVVFVFLRSVSAVNPIAWQNVAFHAALIFNYIDKYDYFSINGVYWTLAIEVQFYVLLPLSIYVALKLIPLSSSRMTYFALLFIVVGILSRCFEFQFVNHDQPTALAHVGFKWVTSHLDLFGFGILLRALEGQATTRRFRFNLSAAWTAIIGALAILYVVAWWSKIAGSWQESRSFWFVAFGSPLACCGFAALLGITNLSPLKQSLFFRSRFLQWIGLISYSFYLYHVGVLFVFGRIFKPMSWGLPWGQMTLLSALICLPITIVVAWAGYNLTEKPFFKVG